MASKHEKAVNFISYQGMYIKTIKKYHYVLIMLNN